MCVCVSALHCPQLMRDQLQQEEQRERQQQQQNAALSYMQQRMAGPPVPSPAITTPQHYQSMQVPVEVLKVSVWECSPRVWSRLILWLEMVYREWRKDLGWGKKKNFNGDLWFDLLVPSTEFLPSLHTLSFFQTVQQTHLNEGACCAGHGGVSLVVIHSLAAEKETGK